MKGEKVKHQIRFKGVGGRRLQEDYGKKVKLETPDHSVDVIVHPWRQKREECVALIPLDVAERFGVRVTNLPKFFKSKVKKTEDEEWLDSSEDVLEERPLPGKERQSIVKAVSELIEENNKIVKENSTCTLPNSEFKIELVEGAEAWFKRQYDIPEKLRPIVQKRMKEWKVFFFFFIIKGNLYLNKFKTNITNETGAWGVKTRPLFLE